MKILAHKRSPIKLTMEFEFDDDAEQREFLAHVRRFRQQTAIKVEGDGSRRVVPMTPQHTKDYSSAKDFVLTFSDTPEGVTGRDLYRMVRELGYNTPIGTISSLLSTLTAAGILKKIGSRNNGLMGSNNKSVVVYQRMKP